MVLAEYEVLKEELHHLYWVQVGGRESQLKLLDHSRGELGNRF